MFVDSSRVPVVDINYHKKVEIGSFFPPTLIFLVTTKIIGSSASVGKVELVLQYSSTGMPD
jgi:hypothetical protein